jgi:hypothetical protein
MIPTCCKSWSSPLILAILSLILGLKALPMQAQTRLYTPIPLETNKDISDVLSVNDIPTGEGGFARDYLVQLEAGDQVAIDLVSEEFDSVLLLLASDGSTVAENDDGTDGSTNALLFARITENGKYIVRVRAFGETGGGKFTLKVSRLRPVKK